MKDGKQLSDLIESDDDVTAHLDALLGKVPSLLPIAEVAGPLPLRRTEPGVPSLVRIICGQQVSTSAAAAIYTRIENQLGLISHRSILGAGFEGLRFAGLSSPKCQTLIGLAESIDQKIFDLDALGTMTADDAINEMVKLKGIGRWTAEVYLLFALGHPDIFPSGDLALQNAVQKALRKRQRLEGRALDKTARKWAPYRGVAARLFWAYYAADTGSEGV